MESRAYLPFRLLTSGIFLTAGWQHLAHPEAVAARLAAAPSAHLVAGLGSAHLLVVLSGIALLAGGLALALGLATRIAAVGLAGVLVPITLTVQVGAATTGPLLKNVAIFGALVLLAAEGGGRASLDGLLRRRGRWLAPAALAALGLGVATLAIPGGAARAVPATAPETAGARVLLLVQQPPQLLAALATGRELLAGRGFPAREVEVLVCGPGISSLVAGSPAEPRLAEAQAAGIRVVACGLSLTEKGIDRATVSPAVTVVENGLVEALRRKAEGFVSVEL